MPAYAAIPTAVATIGGAYLQSRAGNNAAQKQDEYNRAQLAYLQQKDYEAALNAANAQYNNYNQWRAAQETSNDMLQAREGRLGALGRMIGAPERMAVRTYIPEYVEPTLPTAPAPNRTLGSYLGR
jgi:hypothetical protein